MLLFKLAVMVTVMVEVMPHPPGSPVHPSVDFDSNDTLPPPSPPEGYRVEAPEMPPIPEEARIPEGHLTSVEISAKYGSGKNGNEADEGPTEPIDEVIFKATNRTEDGSVIREGDVIVSGDEEFETKRMKRSADDDDDYYDGADGFAKPAPRDDIAIGSIPETPDDVRGEEGRAVGDESMDEILKRTNGIQDGAKPMGSDILMGRAKKRGGSDMLAEMDMLLTKEQYDEIHSQSRRKKRAGIKNEKQYWKKAVLPYLLLTGQGFTERHKTEIYNAMSEWQSKTCIRFEPYTESLKQKLGHNNRIYFQNGNGCSSYVGMLGRGGQPVTLANGCRWKKIVAHELGHAIGLHHEQCRPDRDSFVTINEGNVYPSMKYNFDKYNTRYVDSRSIQYDYLSIMHYGKTAFSKGGGAITIQTHDSSFTNKIGNAKELSASDAKIVNLMYECKTGVQPTRAPVTRTPVTCKDSNTNCPYWKEAGYCEKAKSYMLRHCTKSCGVCVKNLCKDENEYCPNWKKAQYCTGKYEKYMSKNCARSCGTCESAYGDFAALKGTQIPDGAAGVRPTSASIILGFLLLTIASFA